MKITDFVVKGASTSFNHFRQGILYYDILNRETNEIYQYPVPIEDLGGATVNYNEKALTMMRYIRKALEDNTIVKIKG